MCVVLVSGTVYKGIFRGEKVVAIKTMRVSAVTKENVRKFKEEVIARLLTSKLISQKGRERFIFSLF